MRIAKRGEGKEGKVRQKEHRERRKQDLERGLLACSALQHLFNAAESAKNAGVSMHPMWYASDPVRLADNLTRHLWEEAEARQWKKFEEAAGSEKAAPPGRKRKAA